MRETRDHPTFTAGLGVARSVGHRMRVDRSTLKWLVPLAAILVLLALAEAALVASATDEIAVPRTPASPGHY